MRSRSGVGGGVCGVHSFISLLNEVGLLNLINDKKSCSLGGEVGFNYFQSRGLGNKIA